MNCSACEDPEVDSSAGVQTYNKGLAMTEKTTRMSEMLTLNPIRLLRPEGIDDTYKTKSS